MNKIPVVGAFIKLTDRIAFYEYLDNKETVSGPFLILTPKRITESQRVALEERDQFGEWDINEVLHAINLSNRKRGFWVKRTWCPNPGYCFQSYEEFFIEKLPDIWYKVPYSPVCVVLEERARWARRLGASAAQSVIEILLNYYHYSTERKIDVEKPSTKLANFWETYDIVSRNNWRTDIKKSIVLRAKREPTEVISPQPLWIITDTHGAVILAGDRHAWRFGTTTEPEIWLIPVIKSIFNALKLE